MFHEQTFTRDRGHCSWSVAFDCSREKYKYSRTIPLPSTLQSTQPSALQSQSTTRLQLQSHTTPLKTIPSTLSKHRSTISMRDRKYKPKKSKRPPSPPPSPPPPPPPPTPPIKSNARTNAQPLCRGPSPMRGSANCRFKVHYKDPKGWWCKSHQWLCRRCRDRPRNYNGDQCRSCVERWKREEKLRKGGPKKG